MPRYEAVVVNDGLLYCNIEIACLQVLDIYRLQESVLYFIAFWYPISCTLRLFQSITRCSIFCRRLFSHIPSHASFKSYTPYNQQLCNWLVLYLLIMSLYYETRERGLGDYASSATKIN